MDTKKVIEEATYSMTIHHLEGKTTNSTWNLVWLRTEDIPDSVVSNATYGSTEAATDVALTWA